MRKVKVDMTNVESYGKCEEGIHTARVAKIEETQSQGGDDMLKTTFEVVAGNSKGCKVFDNFVLTEKALWKFQLFLKALGIKCEGKIAVDLDKIEGKLLDIEVTHEEYEGQTRAKVSDYTKAGTKVTAAVTDDDDDYDEDEDEEEEIEEKPKKAIKSKSVTKKKPEPEEDEEDEEDDEDWEDDDEEEPEEEEEKPVKKSTAAKKPVKKPTSKKPTTKKKPEPEEEDWEDDDEDWEDDE